MKAGSRRKSCLPRTSELRYDGLSSTHTQMRRRCSISLTFAANIKLAESAALSRRKLFHVDTVQDIKAWRSMTICAICICYELSTHLARAQTSRYPLIVRKLPAAPFGLVNAFLITSASDLLSSIHPKDDSQKPNLTLRRPLSESRHDMPSTHHNGDLGGKIFGRGSLTVRYCSCSHEASSAKAMASSRLPQYTSTECTSCRPRFPMLRRNRYIVLDAAKRKVELE